ncbi:UNVERIFIED_ORG: hypothetical protein QOE_2516 [Clostridioides difficile F501]
MYRLLDIANIVKCPSAEKSRTYALPFPRRGFAGRCLPGARPVDIGLRAKTASSGKNRSVWQSWRGLGSGFSGLLGVLGCVSAGRMFET